MRRAYAYPIYLFLFSLFPGITSAASLGISPGTIEIDFAPGFGDTFSYTLFNPDNETKTVEIKTEGDALAKGFVKLNQKSVVLGENARESLTFDISLPHCLNPGTWTAKIVAQSAPATSPGGGASVGTVVSVAMKVIVRKTSSDATDCPAVQEVPRGASGSSVRTLSSPIPTPAPIPAPVVSYVARIGEGETQAVDISAPDVKEVVLVAAREATSVQVSVQRLAALPADIPAPSAPLHSYHRIEARNAEGKLREARIRFEVDRSWLETNRFSNARMERYEERLGSWTPLPTSRTGENVTHVFYEAVSPGLSLFAITGEPIRPSLSAPSGSPEPVLPSPVSQPASSPTVSTTSPLPPSQGPPEWVVALVMLALAAMALDLARMRLK